MELEGQSIIAAAHELKTPLVLVRQLSLELSELSSDDTARRDELIRRIRLVSERSLRLVDNLTRMARLDDAMFEMEPVQLAGLCREVADELAPLGRALGQELCVKIGRRPLVAVGNRDLLRALLMGLVDNALQYNTGNKPIGISLAVRREQAILSVRDHGAIVDLAEFRNLAAAVGERALPISNRPLSSGLGLLVAGRFAAAMHGKLSVLRHHSGGVTFRAHLPVSTQLSLIGE